jgi:hypothetical protein
MNCCSIIRMAFCLAALLTAPLVFGASADLPKVQAQLLDHAEFLCANCFFGASSYYFCFAADNKILVGYQKTPVLNWQDPSKNYLDEAHRAWTPWTAPGETIPISYDDKHIWLSRPEGKPAKQSFWDQVKTMALWKRDRVKLTRSSMRDIFTHNAQCRADADKAK